MARPKNSSSIFFDTDADLIIVPRERCKKKLAGKAGNNPYPWRMDDDDEECINKKQYKSDIDNNNLNTIAMIKYINQLEYKTDFSHYLKCKKQHQMVQYLYSINQGYITFFYIITTKDKDKKQCFNENIFLNINLSIKKTIVIIMYQKWKHDDIFHLLFIENNNYKPKQIIIVTLDDSKYSFLLKYAYEIIYKIYNKYMNHEQFLNTFYENIQQYCVSIQNNELRRYLLDSNMTNWMINKVLSKLRCKIYHKTSNNSLFVEINNILNCNVNQWWNDWGRIKLIQHK